MCRSYSHFTGSPFVCGDIKHFDGYLSIGDTTETMTVITREQNVDTIIKTLVIKVR